MRQDGLPYANRRDPEDPGVTVYFEYKDRSYCFACDKYKKVWENMVAIRKTIEAIRGIERWGASDMMEKAFQGFVAIESKLSEGWWDILGVAKKADRDTVKTSYLKLRSLHHSDRGGSPEMFNKVQGAWKSYLSDTKHQTHPTPVSYTHLTLPTNREV